MPTKADMKDGQPNNDKTKDVVLKEVSFTQDCKVTVSTR